MALIKNGQITEDTWIPVTADDDSVPADGDIVVDLAHWQAERDGLIRRSGRLGIRLAGGQLIEEIEDDLAHFAVVVLTFPSFTDGRAYSTARLLRERHKFAGEIRASGQVLRDQLFFMIRCGFDAFEVADHRPLDGWLKALNEISVVYQPATDGRLSVLRRRQAALCADAAACS